MSNNVESQTLTPAAGSNLLRPLLLMIFGLLLFVSLVVGLQRNEEWVFCDCTAGRYVSYFLIDIGPSLFALFIGLLLVDYRSEQRGMQQHKEQLIPQLGSKYPDTADTALRIFRARGWGFGYDKTLVKADLAGANLKGADLSGANLLGANLSGARLDRARLVGANLNGAVPGNANLERAQLAGANLSGADLRGANLERARLAGANLGGELVGTSLNGASLGWANLKQTDLEWADLRGAALEWANLSGAYLRKADLEGADLSEANLRGAGLAKANLKNAQLIAANLEGAWLGGANFEGANLRMANLKGSWDVHPQQLSQAKSLEAATMPDGASAQEWALRLLREGKIEQEMFNTLARLAGGGK